LPSFVSKVNLRPLAVFLPLLVVRSLTNAASAPVTIKLNATSATLHARDKKTFEASVGNTGNKAVTWRVNKIAGGGTATGTIDKSGTYTAPANVPSANAITVDAVSAADTTKTASASVTLLNVVPSISSVSTTQVNTALPFTLTITGSGFRSTAKVAFDDKTALSITAQSATQITLKGTSKSAAGTHIRVTVTNPDPGATVSNAKTINVTAPVAVVVSPKTKTIRGLTTTKFSATVSNTETKTVTWAVNGIAGGNATVGTIAPDGAYSAPAVIPASVTATATSTADTSKSDSAQVTLQNPIPVIVSTTTPIIAGANASLTINGTGFAQGAQVLLGNTSLSVKWISSSQLVASGAIQPPVGGVAPVFVQNPDPGAERSNIAAVTIQNSGTALSYAAAKRFLEHATWGPAPDSIAHLQAIGINAWLAEQYVAPISTYNLPIDTTSNLSTLQEQFFKNAVTGSDQLRQRVAFALGQIAVVSGVKLPHYDEMMPYQQMLLNHAFGNYHAFLKDVTLSPAMGHYLDMVNNDIPSGTQSANENYARELMQLFSIGLAQLNAGGTRTTTPATATYSEDDVRAMARVLTGWTYPACFAASKWTNPACFQSPMVAIEAHHDNSAKLFLGTTIQTGSAEGDLDLALQTIEAYQPAQSKVANIAPFVSLRLIQHLVTSNPTPDYVSRVAAVFAQSGGDLKQTVTAILTDTAAGNDGSTLAADQGHLAEPVLYTVALLRALNANTVYAPPLAGSSANMGQDLFYSPSVFNYYSPFYHLPGTPTVAPEFQILNQSTSFYRANYAYRAVRNQISGDIIVDLSNFAQLAADTNKATQTTSLTTMLNAVSQALLGAPMTTDMLNAIMPAMLSTTDAKTRARNAVYLVAVSPQYQVQR
jgi:uncharacterized protein (DUF1800 family)